MAVLVLSLLLLSGIIGGWSAAVFHSFAATPPATMTLPHFLQRGHPSHASVGPQVLPGSSQALPYWNKQLAKAATLAAHPLPSAEPATMKSVSLSLSQAAQATPASGNGTPLHLVGSDANGTRLEVLIPAGALDLSQAKTSNGSAPQGTLTLTLSQVHGHFAGSTTLLGAFQLRMTDAQGQALQGVQVRTPITFIYHYRPGELSDLDLDPTRLVLTWPDLLAAATASKQSTTSDVIPMQNNASTSTLTAQSSVLDPTGSLALGASVPLNQTPPKPDLASVLGNAGQLSYSYPLAVAPGPLGTEPQLALSYTSGDTNGRHSPYSPADSAGEGWSLALGAITADTYPDGTLWYSLSGVDNVNDLLIPESTGNSFATEHLSSLKITRVTVNSQPCFHVWDPDGTYYEFGCTTDSLQYYTDSSGTRTNYRWDLDRVIPANEGPTTANRVMTLSYVHDTVSPSGHTTIRDAALKQITYGTSVVAGTVDFFYQGPTASSNNGVQWITAYGKNEGGCAPPDGLSTTERCDDPLDRSGGLQNPLVMSTLSLQTVKTYVGDDSSASHLDYSYSFSYQDLPFTDCTDSVSLSPAYCAGEHLLTGITPTVSQHGTGHTLPGATFGYTGTQQNSYSDTTQTVGGNPFHAVTNWRYLDSYHDQSNGVGGSVQYHTAWNNSNGTPHTSDGDNRYDALFCDWHASSCTQAPFAPMDQKMWTVQVVTSITASGQDSSSSSLAPATTSYDYWLEKTTGTCAASTPASTIVWATAGCPAAMAIGRTTTTAASVALPPCSSPVPPAT